MKKKVSVQEPSAKPPIEANFAQQATRPHPLLLNIHEGIWFNLVSGPIGGWFSFADHGNPPFDMPVQVVVELDLNGEMRRCVGLGIRRDRLIKRLFLDPIIAPGMPFTEAWEVTTAFPSQGAKLTHWRPLSGPPGI